MKFILAIIWLLISLFVLAGCNSDLETINIKFGEITTSNSILSEQNSVIRFTEYSARNYIHYSLEIVNLSSGMKIDMGDIERYIDKKLKVIISFKDGAIKKYWKPIDNNNIFILLRE